MLRTLNARACACQLAPLPRPIGLLQDLPSYEMQHALAGLPVPCRPSLSLSRIARSLEWDRIEIWPGSSSTTGPAPLAAEAADVSTCPLPFPLPSAFLLRLTGLKLPSLGSQGGLVTSFSGLTAVFVRARMADLLSMPDDVMAYIAEQALSRHEGSRAWCRLASTCSRLWRLQLPRSLNRPWRVLADVHLEGEY